MSNAQDPMIGIIEKIAERVYEKFQAKFQEHQGQFLAFETRFTNLHTQVVQAGLTVESIKDQTAGWVQRIKTLSDMLETTDIPALKSEIQKQIDALPKTAPGMTEDDLRTWASKRLDGKFEDYKREQNDLIRETIDDELIQVKSSLPKAIKEEVAKIPVPKDGKDGVSPIPMDVAQAIWHQFAEERLSKLATDFLSKIELPRDGKDGKDGESPPLQSVMSGIWEVYAKHEIHAVAEDIIKKIPLPKDGKDGVSPSPEVVAKKIWDDFAGPELRAIHSDFLKTLPTPKDGKDGVDGKDGKPGKDAPAVSCTEVSNEIWDKFAHTKIKEWTNAYFSKIDPPVNGKDGAPGKDGKDADPEMVEVAVNKAIEARMPDVRKEIKMRIGEIKVHDGVDGKDGRDALELEILPEIDFRRSYNRGTFGIHAGGLWRAYEKTHQMRGWECIVRGVNAIDVEFDGERTFKTIVSLSSGAPVVKEFMTPGMIFRGPWRAGQKYAAGDCVQFQGLWYAKTETNAQPGVNNQDWQLAVRRGPKGDPGDAGAKVVQP